MKIGDFLLKLHTRIAFTSPRILPEKAYCRGRATGSQPVGQADFSPMTIGNYSTIGTPRAKIFHHADEPQRRMVQKRHEPRRQEQRISMGFHVGASRCEIAPRGSARPQRGLAAGGTRMMAGVPCDFASERSEMKSQVKVGPSGGIRSPSPLYYPRPLR